MRETAADLRRLQTLLDDSAERAGTFLFHMPSVAESARVVHLAKRPAASLSYFEGTDLAVVVHGHATIVDAGDPAFAAIDATQVEMGNQSVREWGGRGVYLRIDAASLFTFARVPDRYPFEGQS